MQPQEPYRTRVTNDGFLDYQMVNVHVSSACRLHQELRRASEEMRALTHHKIVELVQPPHPDFLPLHGKPYFDDDADKVESKYGNIRNFTPVTSENVILTGHVFGLCHRRAYIDLLSNGGKEIHVPESLVLGERNERITGAATDSGEWHRYEHPFQNERDPTIVLREYGIFNTDIVKPNGETIVFFHHSWAKLLSFLQSHMPKTEASIVNK